MKETNIQVFQYNGSNISYKTQGGRLMIYATEMGRVFHHRVSAWTRSKCAKNLTTRLAKSIGVPESDIISTQKEFKSAGTWVHFEVAVEYAKHLNKEFASWLEDRILEVLYNQVPQAKVIKQPTPQAEPLAPPALTSSSPQQLSLPLEDSQSSVATKKPKSAHFKTDSTRWSLPSIPKGTDLTPMSDIPLGWDMSTDLALQKNALTESFRILSELFETKNSIIAQLEEENDNLQARLKEHETKVTYFDTIFANKSVYTATEIAAMYGKTAQWLNNALCSCLMQSKKTNRWIPCPDMLKLGYAVESPFVYTDNQGVTHSCPQYRWTQAGREHIHARLVAEQFINH